MTEKKNFAYTGVLRQPIRQQEEAAWLLRLEKLSASLGVMHLTPLTEPYSETWMRAMAIALVQRHTAEAAHLIIPTIKSMPRMDLYKELFIGLVRTHVPGFREPVNNSGRAKKWTLSERTLLYSRMQKILVCEANRGITVTKAASRLMSLYPDAHTSATLVSRYKAIQKEIADEQRIADDTFEDREREFLESLTTEESAALNWYARADEVTKNEFREDGAAYLKHPHYRYITALKISRKQLWILRGECLEDAYLRGGAKERLDCDLDSTLENADPIINA